MALNVSGIGLAASASATARTCSGRVAGQGCWAAGLGCSCFDSEKSLSIQEQAKPATQHPWPATLPEQVRAVADALAASPIPLTLSAIEARFKGRGPWKKGLPTLLQTLEALGRAQAVAVDGGMAWRG